VNVNANVARALVIEQSFDTIEQIAGVMNKRRQSSVLPCANKRVDKKAYRGM
jgi:hypothetical protein